MRVVITKSPDRKKKFRATLENGRTVDFGASGYSDYTKHKNPLRMRSYVSRHGGKIPKNTMIQKIPAKVHTLMLNVTRSSKENWNKSGGFWSRWFLWSFPDIEGVKLFMLKRFDIIITTR